MAIKLTPSHRKAFERFLELTGMEPFRRSDLAKQLYPLTNPRSLDRAQDAAHALIQEAALGGRVQRHGHLHWMRIESGRTLKSGRRVPELQGTVELKTITRCPAKWASLDMETGAVWVADAKGRWTRASETVMAEIKTALGA